MKQGVTQKRNLVVTGQSRIKHSLVAGLFIPQATSRESSCIRLADPPFEELDQLLREHPQASIEQALTQISLAKTLALAGFGRTAAVLATSPVTAPLPLPGEARAELRHTDRETVERFQTVLDTKTLFANRVQEGPEIRNARFLVKAPRRILEILVQRDTVAQSIMEISEQVERRDWHYEHGDNYGQIETSTGFQFRLEVY